MGIYRTKYTVEDKKTGKVAIRKSPYWSISWTDKKGAQHRESTKCTSKEDAREVLVEKLRAVKKTIHPFLKDEQKINFARFADRFAEEYQGNRGDLSESSRTLYLVLLKKLKEHFGDLLLGDISDSDVDEYIAKRKRDTVRGLGQRKVSHVTINRELAVLRLMLNWAVEKNIIVDNPVKKRVSRRKVFKEEPRKVYFNEDEFVALLAAAEEPWKSFIRVAIHTGMRLEEIQGLRWDELDLKGKCIKLPAARTKGKTSRDVELNSTMMKFFSELKMVRQAQGSEYVFPSPKTGRPYSKCFSNTWKRLLRRAGLKKQFHFHDLRRTFITKAIGAGAGVKDVQEQVGHADASTTLKNYALATKEGKRRVVDLVDFQEPSGEVVDLPKRRGSL